MSVMVLTARPELATNRRLADEAASLGVALTIVDATRVEAHIGAGPALWREAHDLLIAPPAAVLARVGNWRPESVLAALEVTVAAGASTLNPAAAVRRGRDHWATVEALARQRLPVPASMVGADPESLAATAVARLGLPLVVKSRRSRMGIGVMLCRQRDHLECVLDSLWRLGEEVVVQRFLAAGGRSSRLLVIRGQVVAAAAFTATGDEWRSNAARGAATRGHRPSDEEMDLASGAATALGLGLCGIDLLFAEDRWWVCEVNPTPGFLHLEDASGVNVARAIVRACADLG